MLSVVEIGTSGTSDDVEDAVGFCVLVAVKRFVESPFAGHFDILVEDKTGFDLESERVGALIVVDVAAHDEIDFSSFENFGEHADALFLEVGLRGIEGRMVEADDAPFGFGSSLKVFTKPVAEFGRAPVDVDIGIDDSPVDIAVVEGIICHAGEGVGSGGEEILFGGFVALEFGSIFCAGGKGRPI